MRRILICSCLSILLLGFIHSQETKERVYQSENQKLYINKEQGIYLWLSTSPDPGSKKIRLGSDSSSMYTNPMYLDTEGHNTFRSPSAVNPETKETVYPLQDIIFDIYADGIPPSTRANFKSPNTIIISGEPYYTKDLKINLQSTDAVSGIKKLQYAVNTESFSEYTSEISRFKEGENILKYFSEDHVGNKEPVKEKSFYIDNTPPLTNYEVIGNANEKYISVNATIKLTSEDKLAGVKAIYYKINNESAKKYSTPIPVKILANDQSVISYYAVDNLGNKENSQIMGGNDGLQIEDENSKLSYEFYVDREPPKVVLDVLSDTYKGDYNFVSSRSKFKITASDGKSGVQKTNYSINTSAIDLVYAKPFNLDKKGLHYIRIQATDFVGNATDAAIKAYYCDPTPPKSSISVSTPKFLSRDTLFVSTRTKFTLKAKDDISGIRGISYSLDGKLNEEYTKPFSISASGLQTIRYSAQDNVNNKEPENKTEVFVDNEGPVVHYHFSVESIGSKKVREEEYIIYPTNAMIYIAATDARSGGERIEYALNDGSKKSDNPIKALKPGNYQIQIKAYDVLGNVSTQEIKFSIEE